VTQTGHKPPQIVPDERTNSLVITCEPDEVDPIERLVAQLDVPVAAKK
jgi:type II secretory pathway component HofQ